MTPRVCPKYLHIFLQDIALESVVAKVVVA